MTYTFNDGLIAGSRTPRLFLVSSDGKSITRVVTGIPGMNLKPVSNVIVTLILGLNQVNA